MFKQSIWREQNALLYFSGTLLSKLGDKFYIIAIPWLIYELTQSAVSMGVMFLVQTLPFIFVSPIAGVLADRFPRRILLFVSALLQGTLAGVIPVLHILQVLHIWHIYVLGFFIACVGAIFSVVNSTVVPQLFKKEKLMKVNATHQFIDTSSVLFGSALAGILISKIGVYNVLLLDAFSFFPIAISILFLTFLTKETPSKIKSNSWEQLKAGADFLLKHHILGPFTLLILIVNIANGALISMLVYFSREKLFLSSEEVGWVYAGAATAQVAAIAFVNFLGDKGNPIRLMLINIMISAVGIITVALSWNWQTLLLAVAIQSAPVIMFNVLFKTMRQRLVPSHIFGRVNGLISMLGLGTLPLAGFLTGVLAEMIDIRIIFFVMGICSLLVTIRFLRLTKLRLIEQEDELTIPARLG
ncbi:MFS transporter [Sutcliffiella rhizosphaerae]|uniref:Enterobactin exporter EntS n=1 Tax=Sutcliffiella rhizosphaerae TaxID=2880967 RepID=A0ABN8AGG0_9BACI|nr:MFS transporter [Sutcliffiella rhizosphaerae]CAG9623196.1 Enterobactin exporter EntS [Sutcliffiella rhizosphaerae]